MFPWRTLLFFFGGCFLIALAPIVGAWCLLGVLMMLVSLVIDVPGPPEGIGDLHG